MTCVQPDDNVFILRLRPPPPPGLRHELGAGECAFIKRPSLVVRWVSEGKRKGKR